MENIIKKRIMRRVYLIWFLRSVYAKLMLVGIVAAASTAHISVIDVAKNTSHNSGLMMIKYLASSFAVADMVSKVLLLAFVLGMMAVGWEFVKTAGAKPFARMKFR